MSFAGLNNGSDNAIVIGNFDVLVEEIPHSGGCSSGPSNLRLILNMASHVGNNRFQVLLRMNAKQYEAALIAGENTTTVVERVADIVCRQVVPNGRFLVQESRHSWTPLPRDQVLEFVREQLDQALDKTASKPKAFASPAYASPPPVVAAAAAASSATSSASSSPKLSPLPLPDAPASRQTEPSSLLTEEDNEALLRALGPTFFEGPGDPGDKKRRRRSSLLRRSVSESFLITNNSNNNNTSSSDFDFDKKKTLRKQTHFDEGMASAASFVAASLESEQAALELEPTSIDDMFGRHPPDFGPTTATGQKKPALPRLSFMFRGGRRGSFDDNLVNARSNVVTTAEALDVIFQPSGGGAGGTAGDGTMGTIQHTGNNRLNVLMDLQSGKYLSAMEEQRRLIIQDMIETVQKHWGGRFLMGSSESGYTVLSDEDATSMLLTAYNERLGRKSDEPLEQYDPRQEATVSEMRPKSQSLNSTFPSNFGITTSTTTKPKSQSVDAVLLQHFAPAAADPASINQMRNQALQSLQKRKKRQGLTFKIRNLTALTRSTSEPARYFNTVMPPGPLNGTTTSSAGLPSSSSLAYHPAPAQPFQPHPPSFLPHGGFASSFSSADSVLIGQTTTAAAPPPQPQSMMRTESAPMGGGGYGVSIPNQRPGAANRKASLPELSGRQINDLMSSMTTTTTSGGSMTLPGYPSQQHQQHGQQQGRRR